MPNSFAYLMLLIWPMISIGLFRRLSIERALIWSILGAYLVLPPLTRFDFPLIPPLDKTSIPSVAAFGICVLMLGKRVPILPESRVGRLLMILFIFTPFATVMTNTDPIFFATGGLPGLRIHDSVSAVTDQAIAVLPFVLARRFLATETAQREILFALMFAGLVYSLPMLLEVRLSPQLNVWIYGFFQHDFAQMMRQGGFRPIVFLPHALWVAFFALMALVAAVTLWHTSESHRRGPFLLSSAYLGIVLVLCKSLAAMVYAAFLLPLARFTGFKTQFRIAALLGLIAVLYPLLRGADLIPVRAMVAQAESSSADRAQSLAYRFHNEDQLLVRANERPLLGWGPWGRSAIYDPISGKMLSVVDGRWIIVIGQYGWFGYIAEFGLLALPLLLLARRAGGIPARDVSRYAGPLALMLAINMIDMLPNATLIPFTWLLAGAVLGYAEALKPVRSTRTEEARVEASPEAIREQSLQPARARTIL